MGLIDGAFKLGFLLLGTGLVVAFLSAPLGFLLGRLGMLVIGVALVGGVLWIALNVLFAVATATSDSANEQRPNQPRRNRPPSAGRQPSRRPRRERSPPASGPENLDLDVEAIDDYYP